MKKTGFEEQEAFRRIRKSASDHSLSLIDVSWLIVTTGEAMERPCDEV
jgi:AmiR/NasT family two-component response regulator